MLYNPPLSVAAKNGRKELVTYLLKKGAEPDGRDHLGIYHDTEGGDVRGTKIRIHRYI